MDASTSTGKLVAVLKRQLKTKGLQYRDVAARLRVSEGTVKRYLSGKGITVSILEKLAQIVELDLLSLVVLGQQNITEPELTKAQQTTLRSSKVSLGVFYCLSLGFTPPQLIQEFEIAHEAMDAILARLQGWGLIRRLSTNSVQMLVKPKFAAEVDADVRERHIGMSRAFLSEVNFSDEKCQWTWTTARLSQTSIVRLRELMNRFASEVQALTKSEIALPPDNTQWYRLIVCANPVSRKRMFPWK
jgi:transcriptional regulator with XRE-family HTH domain